MEWKEKGLEAIFAAAIAFVGAIFVKKAKPAWNELRRLTRLTDNVDELNRNVGINDALVRSILHTASDAIFISNTKGEVIFVNMAYLQLTGMRTQKDAYGFGFLQVIPEDDREDILEQGERLAKHPSSFEDIVRFEHFITKEIITTLCRSEPLFYKGELVETLGRLTIINKIKP